MRSRALSDSLWSMGTRCYLASIWSSTFITKLWQLSRQSTSELAWKNGKRSSPKVQRRDTRSLRIRRWTQPMINIHSRTLIICFRVLLCIGKKEKVERRTHPTSHLLVITPFPLHRDSPPFEVTEVFYLRYLINDTTLLPDCSKNTQFQETVPRQDLREPVRIA